MMKWDALLSIITCVIAFTLFTSDCQTYHEKPKPTYKLLGLFPIRTRKSSLSSNPHSNCSFEEKRCGELDYNGILLMEAAKFAIDKVNRFLPIDLSLEYVDTCESQDYAIKMLIPYILSISRTSNAIQPPLLTNSCCENYRFNESIIGVIGAGKSGVTLAVQDLLKIFNIPQISYMSTSYALSNTQIHETFTRTVPSDASRMKVLINLLKEFHWLNLCLVHDSFPFARDGRDAFENLYIREKKLNIILNERFDDDSLTTLPINLCKKVAESNVTVVMTFLTRNWLTMFLRNFDKVCPSEVTDQIMWIGCDSWLMTDFQPSYLRFFKNALILSPEIVRESDFQEYLDELSKSPEKVLWYKEYLRQINCTADNVNVCGRGLFSYVDTSVYVHNVVNAVYAFAHVLKNTTQQGRPRFQMNQLRNIVFNDTNGRMFQFVNGVDGPNRFSVAVFNETTGQQRILDTLEGTSQIDLKPSTRKLLADKFPASVCQKICPTGSAQKYDNRSRCWNCKQCSFNQILQPTNNSLPVQEYDCVSCPIIKKANENRSLCIDRDMMNHSKLEALIVDLLSGLGILLVIFLSGLMFLYRKTAIVKASGRETCAFSFIGITMSFISAIVVNSPPNKIICILIYTLPGFCSTVSYAAILARIIRISRIFNSGHQFSTNKDLTVRFISPAAQIVFILLCTLLEVFVLTILCVISTPTDRLDHNADRIVCGENRDSRIFVFQQGLIVPTILMIVSAVYAVKIRKVPYGFNESMKICFVNFVNIALLLMALITFLILWQKEMEADIIISYSLYISAMTQAMGLYTHKAFIILFHKEKNTIEHVLSNRRPTISGSRPRLSRKQGKDNTVKDPRSDSIESVLSATGGSLSESNNLEQKNATQSRNLSNPAVPEEVRRETKLSTVPENSRNIHL